MRIEIWSDVVCPWCYIGKRRLEEALAGFEHRDQVEIEWRSFQLDPSAPTEPTEDVAEMLGRKYGGGRDAALTMVANVQQVAAEVGLDFSRHPEALHLNTVDAHRLLHAVGERRGELKEALLHAYFVEARNLADHDVLVDVATSIGIDADEARAVLSSDAHAEAVAADAAQAQAYGATGVPFFVFDAKYGVSGAQPVEAFTQVLERAWADRPTIQLVTAGEAAPGCDGDECAI